MTIPQSVDVRLKRLGRLDDGTAYYAPLGELVYDTVADRVQCHLCGEWFRALAPSHLWQRHGWTREEYVEAFGLRVRRPLVSPSVSSIKSVQARRWYDMDPRIRDNLAKGLRMMLDQKRRAQWAAQTRGVPLPLERLRSAQKSIGAAMATQARTTAERRAARLRELGFADIESYLRARYVDEKKGILDVTAELRVGPGYVREELKRLGLGPRRPAQDANEAWHRRRRAEQQRVAQLLGFATFRDYLQDRLGKGWRFQRIAAEVGHHPAWVKAGCRDEGIRPPRFDMLRNSRQAFAVGRAHYAEQMKRRRVQRLTELGFTNMCDYLRDRYLQQGWWIAEIKRELHAGSPTIAQALRDCGLTEAPSRSPK